MQIYAGNQVTLVGVATVDCRRCIGCGLGVTGCLNKGLTFAHQEIAVRRQSICVCAPRDTHTNTDYDGSKFDGGALQALL